MSTITIPGLVDAHVHLRSPGAEHKESVATGTAAALAGGFVAVLAMPNTSPPLTDAARHSAALAAHGSQALCDVGLFVGGGADAAAAAAAAPRACGLKLYLDRTYGELRCERLETLSAHFQEWPGPGPIVVHAEDIAVAAAIGLAAAHRQRLHVAHVSRADEIALIAAAKEAGLSVTCEVTPHHLFLTDDDARGLGGFGEVRPPLASAADVEALWRHLSVIDCIATDHAPHTREEKSSDSPPAGVPGLETAVPLVLTAVHDGRLGLDRAVELLSSAPARIFGVETPAESSVEVELGPRWTLPERGWQTRADWTPFAGRVVSARVRRTILRGRVAWEDGRVRVPPGYGRIIAPRPDGG